jgi:hypothetical protein
MIRNHLDKVREMRVLVMELYKAEHAGYEPDADTLESHVQTYLAANVGLEELEEAIRDAKATLV